MAPIRYSLHYEDYSEHLMSRFGKLLQMQSLVDMTLMCSSHTLRVHKVVLASSSAYFQEVLQKQSGEPLIILKMRFSVLKCLVEFMYCGKTQCLEENLDELVAAAQFLKIKGLSKVTKEGLGITSNGELPAFTPPVVIDRPPQSLIDLHAQESGEQHATAAAALGGTDIAAVAAPHDARNLSNNKDMVVRIPFDITGGAGAGGGAAGAAGHVPLGIDYHEIRPRRGRPTVKRGAWESGGAAGAAGAVGAAGRGVGRRDHDSRKALHRLRHLHARHLQDYMDRVSLSQAVNSICGPEPDESAAYAGVAGDMMYMQQGSAAAEGTGASEPPQPGSAPPGDGDGVGTVMSQYVNALKSAGLPTDLPILFEAGDGTYINVNEQVLLDMVHSGEIQYEVIEQPNIIEKVADPNEIKSIDDLSKSIERGEMLLDPKNYTPTPDYGKERSQAFGRDVEGMDSLDAILSDNLESYDERQNYVVLEPPLQDSNAMENVTAPDFSCIDGDIQFFTKTINEDVKKYYEQQRLNEAEAMEELCPTSSTLDTNYTMSLLDTKTSHLITDNIDNQYNAYNAEELRPNDEYDFGLQLPHSSDFKGDPLDSLVDSAKEDLNRNEQNLSPRHRELSSNGPTSNCDSTHNLGDGMLNDLIDFEHKIDVIARDKFEIDKKTSDCRDEFQTSDLIPNETDFKQDITNRSSDLGYPQGTPEDEFHGVTVGELSQNDPVDNWGNEVENDNKEVGFPNKEMEKNENTVNDSLAHNKCDVVDLTISKDIKTEHIDESYNGEVASNKENICPNLDNINSTLQDDIPFAVGLLPLKQVQPVEEAEAHLKRKSDTNSFEEPDGKCIKRKSKCKKLNL